MKQNNHRDMKEDGDNLLSHLAARQRGTRNSKISFEIFKKVFLGRQLKQVKGRFIANTFILHLQIDGASSRSIERYFCKYKYDSVQKFQDPKPFESTSGKPIEAAGRLLIVNQEGSQAERFDCEYGDDGHWSLWFVLIILSTKKSLKNRYSHYDMITLVK